MHLTSLPNETRVDQHGLENTRFLLLIKTIKLLENPEVTLHSGEGKVI